MGTEQSLQEQTFKAYINLEAEELRELVQALRDATGAPRRDIAAIEAIREFVVKRVTVIKEADALFKATKAAREKVTA